MAFLSERTTLVGWHRRLAHPNEATLRRLVSTYNLHVSNFSFPNVCVPCQMAKSHRLPLVHRHESSMCTFDLVYSDVWGPAPINSINGTVFYFIFG